jgi:hypothetical protein
LIFFANFTSGLKAGITSGLEKAIFKLSDKPLFNTALIDTSFFKPSSVRCCLP